MPFLLTKFVFVLIISIFLTSCYKVGVEKKEISLEQMDSVSLEKLALVENNKDAQYLLAKKYLEKKENAKNIDQGVRWLAALYEQGDIRGEDILLDTYSKHEKYKSPEKEELILQKKIERKENGANKKYAFFLLAKNTEDADNQSIILLEALQDKDTEVFTKLAEIYFRRGNTVKAFEIYLAAADMGSKEAQARVGIFYRDGVGTERNNKKAIDWMGKAAGQKNSEVYESLADLLAGEKDNVDWTKVTELYEKAALAGKLEKYHALGSCYLDGKGRPKNEEQAIVWFKKGEDNGDSESINKLGLYYQDKKQEEKAIGYFEKAASAGHGQAALSAGRYYTSLFQKNDKKEDREKAFLNYLQAAKAGILDGKVNTAYCYLYGIGTTSNVINAYYWAESASEEEHPVALRILADLKLRVCKASDDYNKIRKLYEKAIEKGDAASNCGIAYLRFFGKAGFPEDTSGAIVILDDLAKKGNAQANYYLGMIYYKGGKDELQSNTELALEYFKKSAELGCPDSYSWVGYFLEYGYGGEQNLQEAARWYTKGIDKGDSGSMIRKSALINKEVIHEDAQGDALSLLKKAADLYNIRAFHELARYYLIIGLRHKEKKYFIEATKWIFIDKAIRGESLTAEDRERMSEFLSEEEIKEIQNDSQEYLVTYVGRLMDNYSADFSDRPKNSGDAEFKHAKASGSGFFISEDGHIITNNHVIEGAKTVKIKVGDSYQVAQVIASDKKSDLALLKVQHKTSNWLRFSNPESNDTAMGEDVFTIGFPNPRIQGIEPKLTQGQISSTEGMNDDPDTMQISTPVQPGNSGGPLLNMEGQVVGVVNARMNDRAYMYTTGTVPQNINYAIKTKKVFDFLRKKCVLPTSDKSQITNKKSLKDRAKDVKPAVVLILVY